MIERLSDQSELWLSRQVLREYAVVVSRTDLLDKPLLPEKIAEDIISFQKIFNIADEISPVTEILADLIKTYSITGKKVHDANIVASMMYYKISTLFTYNSDDFKKFKEIDLIKTK